MMRASFAGLWREYRGFALFVLLMFIFRSVLADWNSVPTGSMNPTILEGDRIFVNRLAYDLRIPFTHVSLHRFADPARGDIIVFDSKAAGLLLVKRVIGLPGDTVQMRDNRLTINGVEAGYAGAGSAPGAVFAVESYGAMKHRIELVPGADRDFSSFGPVKVPPDQYLVLGDNRDNSADSRVHGFVPREEILGDAKTVVLSVDYRRYYLPRMDRFFHSL